MSYAEKYLTSRQWAILEEYLQLMLDVGARDGDARDETLEGIVSRYGRPLAGTRETTVRDGVAIIPAAGPMFRYANMFTEISGATSFERLASDFSRALEDPSVRSIVLDINSPGGEVDGASETAALIRSARGQKPVVAFVSHLGASAAMWIASAADRVLLADTAMVGSVGVVATVRRPRGSEDRMEFVSSQSPKKRQDPWGEGEAGAAARQEIQARVDAMAEVFINTVAENLGMDPQAVAATQGALFVGADAVAAGLASGVTTLEALVNQLGSGTGSGTLQLTAAAGAVDGDQPLMEEDMDFEKLSLDELRANRPDIVSEIASTEAQQERERIVGIMGINVDGFDDLKLQMIQDPTVTKGEAALRILNARTEREQRQKQVAKDALEADEAAVAEVVTTPALEENDEAAAAAAAEAMAEHANFWQERGNGL